MQFTEKELRNLHDACVSAMATSYSRIMNNRPGTTEHAQATEAYFIYEQLANKIAHMGMPAAPQKAG